MELRRFFFTDECFALSPTKRLCQQIIDKKLDIKWTCEMRFEKHLTRELLASMRDAGCLKIVFGLESFNQRVMDFMKKGIKQEWVRRIADDCVDLGIAVHCYIIVGFPTEKEEEARETMNFIVENKRLNELLRILLSALPLRFGKRSTDHERPGQLWNPAHHAPVGRRPEPGFFL